MDTKSGTERTRVPMREVGRGWLYLRTYWANDGFGIFPCNWVVGRGCGWEFYAGASMEGSFSTPTPPNCHPLKIHIMLGIQFHKTGIFFPFHPITTNWHYLTFTYMNEYTPLSNNVFNYLLAKIIESWILVIYIDMYSTTNILAYEWIISLILYQ